MSVSLMPERRTIHQCSICGGRAPWSDHWQWYGSIKESEESGAMVKTCSDDCRAGLGQRALDRLLKALVKGSQYGVVEYLGPQEVAAAVASSAFDPPPAIKR